MRLTIAAVGRAREGPMRALYDDYVGRLPWQVTLREVAEDRIAQALAELFHFVEGQ